MSDTTQSTAASGATPQSPREYRRRRRGYLWPMLLIAVGVFFLLGNLGYLPGLSWRAVASLWPVILILIGIEIIVARREPLLALGLEALVVIAALALVVAQPTGVLAPVLGGPTPSSSFTVPRGSASTLQLRVDGGAGSYKIQGGSSSLLDARSDNGDISVRDERRGDVADVQVQPAGTGDAFWFGGRPPSNVDIHLASDVPTSLRVSGGAGDFNVDLTNVRIQDARVDTGASRLDLTLPAPSGNVAIRVGAGAATINIVVPDNVEARITTTGGMVSQTVQNPRFGSASGSVLSRSGSSVETPGYAAAKDRIDVTISAGASSITIR